MKTTYLVAWDMLTRNNARRTYTHWFNNEQDAEAFYKAKKQTFSTVQIWCIKSELAVTEKGEVYRNHEYIHKPEYVWR